MTETYPWAWYSDPAVLARRAGADLPPGVALRRPRGAAAGAVRRYFACDDRRAAGRSSPATATASCARSSTSASTAAPRSPRARAAARRSSARTTPGRTASTAGCARRRARRSSTSSGVSLVPLRLEAWGPFLFVCADPEAPFPLAELALPFDPADARLPRARRVRARGELEDRRRELPRVLPLPGRAPRVQRASSTSTRTRTVLEGDGARWSQYGKRARRRRRSACSTSSGRP